MVARRVGGDESNVRYLTIYMGGVLLGSGIRIAAFLLPDRLVNKLEAFLLDGLS